MSKGCSDLDMRTSYTCVRGSCRDELLSSVSSVKEEQSELGTLALHASTLAIPHGILESGVRGVLGGVTLIEDEDGRCVCDGKPNVDEEQLLVLVLGVDVHASAKLSISKEDTTTV